MAATIVLTAVYAGSVFAVDAVVSRHLRVEVDQRLGSELQESVEDANRTLEFHVPRRDTDDIPVSIWEVTSTGTVVPISDDNPTLPARFVPRTETPVTIHLGTSLFRLELRPTRIGRLVGAESLAEVTHVSNVLLAAAGLAAPFLVLAAFCGSVLIGFRASAPVELARRRQLEFTADASHELRTPLTVIEAEIQLALREPRDAERYRQALELAGAEGMRLRHIVEDLLWLARFDTAPPAPADEPVDLVTIADASAARFQSVAAGRGITLSVDHNSPVVTVSAPPEWIDRLAGVLVDNACRYASDGGFVRITADTQGNRSRLVVEDNGPGIPVAERPRLFDRFHRATEQQGGHGLGLAIADAIVHSTGGRWQIGTSPMGGARMEVSWHRP